MRTPNVSAPPFPATTPTEGENVTVTLDNGVTLTAYWDGTQWWAGINGEPQDVPISNDHVSGWEPSS